MKNIKLIILVYLVKDLIGMDIQTRKIAFVQDFLKLQNEEIISQLETILRKKQHTAINQNFEPMTLEEFNERIDASMEDSKNGKLINARDLKAEIDSWS